MKRSLPFFARALAALCLAFGLPACQKGEKNPTASLQNWAVEQLPGGTTIVKDGALEISDVAGCTVWYREKL
ncbi:MAG: hypothetical protein ABIQ12_03555, partial [Opitutaceae bacterium]